MPPAEYSKGYGLNDWFVQEVTLSSLFEGLLFDLFSSPEDLFPLSEVHISRRDARQRFMITLMIVVVDKLRQGLDEFFRTVIVIQLHDVFHAPVVAFNFALGLWMTNFAMYRCDALVLQKRFQFCGHVTRAVVR